MIRTIHHVDYFGQVGPDPGRFVRGGPLDLTIVTINPEE